MVASAEPPVLLWEEFVDQLFREAGDAGGASEASGAGEPQPDWHAMALAAEEAKTPEEALGRRIVSAFEQVSEISATRQLPSRHVRPAPVELERSAEPPVAAELVEDRRGVDAAPPAVTSRLLPELSGPPPGVMEAPGAAGSMAAAGWPVPPPAVAPVVDAAAPTAWESVAGVVPAAVPVAWESAPMGTVAHPAKAPPGTQTAVMESPVERRRRILASGFLWVRNIGILLIAFAAWQLWGTSIQHSHAQSSLKSQFESHVQASGPYVDKPNLVPVTVRLPEPAPGTVVGHLVIPAIGVDQFVVEGTSAAQLAMGPGHYAGTAMPGQQGNVAIAGHRTTYGAPFDSLDHLVLGDQILLTTNTGQQLRYKVVQPPVAVSPRDVAILNDAGDNRITLTTCTPRFQATQRLVVVGTLDDQALSVPTHHRVVRRTIVSAGAGWDLRSMPLALVALTGLVLLGVYHRRISDRFANGARWVVLVPLWIGGIYFLFVSLTALLPANL